MSKEQVDSNEATRVADFPLEGGLGGLTRGGVSLSRGPFLFGLSEDEKKAIAMRPEAFITYRTTYRCKHCGKEWARLSTEETPLPREYVEDEED